MRRVGRWDTGNRSRGSEDPWKQMTGRGKQAWLQFVKWPREVDSGLAQQFQGQAPGPRTQLSLKPVSQRPRACTSFCALPIASKPPSPHHSGPRVLPHPMAPNSPLASLHLSPRASPPPVPHAAESPVLPSSSQLHPSE